ncbi:ABC transporter ATP-binding protein [Polluticoccus soli]|uniref:ABC transporter ATP-binding protein n=1 Tax=Polluticoccus soli TaxID=3034150 RepID=UPI0023E279EC|nr:ABC transporter ATP-binding protein [Flavipsychrobacter sp. JY13-12]
MSFAIEIENLRKHYKGAWAPSLDGLSLTVQRGQVMGLLGPNGAGKTTTINILCGLVLPDQGSARVLGRDCVKDILDIRKIIGVAPQQIALFSNLTAWENFRYIGRLYGLDERSISDRGDKLLERLGLDKHADKRINRYSGGMKRRANIIASLLHQPELLILDEPTAGVDVQSRALILDFLQEYNQQGHTILYTSHLMEEAEKICDEVVIIDEGKYVTSGAPKALIEQTPNCKRLEDVFLHYTGHSVRD